MPRPAPAAARRWQVALILTVFGLAVTASALAGWWYARESTPHQGPLILISVDGLRPGELHAYGGSTGRAPAIDALSADAVVFERAYAHSPLTLPAHASIMAGQLPFEHGVRDEAGFTLKDEARSLPELLQNRGFETGAAVSSFLLRPESGLSQGFSFFDAELPGDAGQPFPIVARDGTNTTEAAERWLRGRRGHRFFLFVQVNQEAAESTVTRLVDELKSRDLYDRATIVLTADRADPDAGMSLDEAALHVPLVVKQPEGEGAGRRVAAPVQHIDLLPTVLDLVRAPIPSGLRGRSLRPVLDGDEGALDDRPIYAETLAALFRFGGPGKFLLATQTHRYLRINDEAALDGGASGTGQEPEAVELRHALDRLLQDQPLLAPTAIDPADEDAFAALGYLGGPLFGAAAEPLDPDQEAWLLGTHRAAAVLASQKDYFAAIDRLREITRIYPRMPAVHYQLGMLLGRVGRVDEAARAFRQAASVEPDNPYVPAALADLLLRAGQPQQARPHAELAVALAEHHDGRSVETAAAIAARVTLALDDVDAALAHADAAGRAGFGRPLSDFVRGRAAHAAGRYEEALVWLEAALAVVEQDGRPIEDLRLSLGETLVALNRQAEAEAHFRGELRDFPRSVRAYSGLAALLHESQRGDALQETLDALVDALPTPEGYRAAARLWSVAGEPSRAAALRAEARNRFPRGPSAARPEPDVRR